MPRSRPPRPRKTAAARPPAPATSAQDPTTASDEPSAPAKGVRRKPQRDPDDGFVAVGRVLGAFGLNGELRVQSLTDNPKRFAPRSKLWLGDQPVTVSASREAQGYVYIRLKGFPDRTAVEPFAQRIVQVPEADLPPLPEGEFYRFQLIGLEAFDTAGTMLGVVEEVLETGANDVYRLRTSEAKEVLVPALANVIVSVDLEAKRIVLDPPDWR